MENISMIQALEIWSELWQAYFGKNGFGGDTAEIYAYRLMPDHPGFEMNEKDKNQRETGLQTARSLYSLLKKFSKENQCLIEIMKTREEGREIGPWFTQRPFFHRCHVRVTKKKQPKNKEV